MYTLIENYIKKVRLYFFKEKKKTKYSDIINAYNKINYKKLFKRNKFNKFNPIYPNVDTYVEVLNNLLNNYILKEIVIPANTIKYTPEELYFNEFFMGKGGFILDKEIYSELFLLTIIEFIEKIDELTGKDVPVITSTNLARISPLMHNLIEISKAIK